MYSPSPLFWYKFVFMAELIIGEALTAHRLRRRRFFALRLLSSVIICFGVAAALPIASYNALYCSFMFLVMFASTVACMALCFKEKPLNLLFCALAGYTTQHIAYELYDLSVLCITGGNAEAFSSVYGSSPVGMIPISVNFGAFQSKPNPLFFMIYAFIYGVIYLLSYIFTESRIKKCGELSLKNSVAIVFAGLFFVFNILISAVVIYRSQAVFDFAYIALLQTYNILGCFVIMYLMFETALRGRLVAEANDVRRLWTQDRKQYAYMRDNINYINIKCHDLKHRIRTIGGENEIDAQALAELESAVAIYDTEIKTGSVPLDVILTEKSVYCSRHGIEFDCMADGSALAFMNDGELYSLFGNIIDNAIEAVQKLPAPERHIDLYVRRINGGFVRVCIANRFAVAPRFDDGLPVTTKADKRSHGLGMKSVRMLCNKYDAELAISTENDRFTLTIVFALPSKA